MKRVHRTAWAALFFFPELAVIALILADPKLFEALLGSIATPIFASCATCLASGQFMGSLVLVGYCLLAHLVRFAVLNTVGGDVWSTHRPGVKAALISILIVTAYAVFVWTSLSDTAHVQAGRLSAILDVVAASVIALAFLELILSAMNLAKKEKPQ